MDEDNKIAVMGDYDSIYGFASLGLSTFPVDGQEDAVRTLKNLASSGYGIIYITEELAALVEKQIDKYKEAMTPAIIQIPGVKGNTGDGVRAVRRSVEQAVGSDILFGE
ncbi:MAG: V-type ATP synthase subunit F [Eubacterium sp.]|nr:V-type ATP synthase subunit F [Eubacterium sp.]